MKNITYIFMILFGLACLTVRGQTYTVLDYEGTVVLNGKPIYRGEHLEIIQQLSGNKNAFVCFLHPKTGKFLLTFEKGKPIVQSSGQTKDSHSELYELTIGDFLKAHLSRKPAGKRGFDYFDFFSSFPASETPRLLIIDQDTIPLVTQSGLHIRPDDRFVSCVYMSRDSIHRILPKADSSYLFLSRKALGIGNDEEGKVVWKLKFVFQENGKEQQAEFSTMPYQSHILTRAELMQIIRVMHTAFTDQDELRDQVFAHLDDFYGKFHTEVIQSLIDQVLAEK